MKKWNVKLRSYFFVSNCLSYRTILESLSLIFSYFIIFSVLGGLIYLIFSTAYFTFNFISYIFPILLFDKIKSYRANMIWRFTSYLQNKKTGCEHPKILIFTTHPESTVIVLIYK